MRCYDGSPNVAAVTNGLCNTLDLSKPHNIGASDWVLSLEVGEHIPRQYEDAFIQNLHNSNRLGMVLSWAVEGQVESCNISCQQFLYLYLVLDAHLNLPYLYMLAVP